MLDKHSNNIVQIGCLWLNEVHILLQPFVWYAVVFAFVEIIIFVFTEFYCKVAVRASPVKEDCFKEEWVSSKNIEANNHLNFSYEKIAADIGFSLMKLAERILHCLILVSYERSKGYCSQRGFNDHNRAMVLGFVF